MSGRLAYSRRTTGKHFLYLMAATLVSAVSVFAVANAQEPPDARVFIDQVYRLFPENPVPADPNGPAFRALFAPQLAKLIKQDLDETPAGYVGFLDFDPFCQCQDTGGFHHEILSVDGSSSGAVVMVRNSFAPPTAASSRIVTYRLSRVGNTWRIADIETAEMPSFRGWLAKALSNEHASH